MALRALFALTATVAQYVKIRRLKNTWWVDETPGECDLQLTKWVSDDLGIRKVIFADRQSERICPLDTLPNHSKSLAGGK